MTIEPSAPTAIIEDSATLEDCERLFRDGERAEKRGQLAQAIALKHIRDERLYRERFATFEEYVEKRLGYTKVWAYGRIGLAGVAAELTMVNSPAVTNERQARAIKPVLRDHGPEVAAEVLREAVDDDGNLTARAITETIRAKVEVIEEPARTDRVVVPTVVDEPRVERVEVLTAEEWAQREGVQLVADEPDPDDLLPEQSKFERRFWQHLRQGQELVKDLDYPQHFNEPMIRLLTDLIEALNRKQGNVTGRGLRVVNGGRQ